MVGNVEFIFSPLDYCVTSPTEEHNKAACGIPTLIFVIHISAASLATASPYPNKK